MSATEYYMYIYIYISNLHIYVIKAVKNFLVRTETKPGNTLPFICRSLKNMYLSEFSILSRGKGS